MLYASFASSCQQLFSKSFQKGVSAPRSSLPRGLSQSRCASARRRFMPKTGRFVKHFFRILLTFSSDFYQKSQFIGFFGCLFSKTLIFAFLSHAFFSGSSFIRIRSIPLLPPYAAGRPLPLICKKGRAEALPLISRSPYGHQATGIPITDG